MVGLTSLVLATTSIGLNPAGAAPASIHPVGRIDFGDCGVSSESGIDSSLGVLAVVCELGTGTWTVRTYSTSTLQQLANASLNVSSGSAINNLSHLAVDERHHVVFLAAQAQAAAGTPTPSDIYGISLLALMKPTKSVPAAVHISFSPIPATAAPAGGPVTGSPTNNRNPTGPAADTVVVPTGTYYDPADDSLYVMAAEEGFGAGALVGTSAHGVGAQDVYVYKYVASTGQIKWVRNLGECAYSAQFDTTGLQSLNDLSIDDPIFAIHDRGKSTLYAGCLFSRGYNPNPASQIAQSSTPGVLGGSMLTYSIPLDSAGSPVDGQFSYALGRANSLTGLGDADDGRIWWIASAFTQTGAKGSAPTAVVFDARHGVYDGAPSIAIPSDINFSVAVGGGRFYAAGKLGIVVVDARADPPGQGIIVPSYSCQTSGLRVDPRLHRLFIRPYQKCDGSSNVVSHQFLVYQDDLPSVAAAAAPDPDSYTSQIPEKPGVTTTQFSGHGEATGTRIRLIGGTTGLVKGATFSFIDYLEAAGIGASKPDYSTRQLSFADVSGVGLDGYQSSANARVVSVDGNTVSDVKNQTHGQANVFYKEVHCSDPGLKKGTETDSMDSSAEVSCDSASKDTSASSQAGLVGFTVYALGPSSPAQALGTLPVTIQHSLTSSHVFMDPARGLVSVTHSEARGVDIGGIVITEIDSSTECVAHGHSRTAKCTYTRTVGGIKGPTGNPIAGGACSQTFSPVQSIDTCQTLLAQLNSLYPGILVFGMPNPDLRPGFLGGSPGGYVGVAAKDLYEHLQDNVLNYDNSSQVPGLEVLYVNDSVDGPSRLDVQLANVEAESHYGIQMAPAEQPFTDNGGGTLAESATTTLDLPQSASHHVAGPTSLIQAIQDVVRRLFQGVTWLLRNPLTALLIASFLTLLVAPLLTAWRRGALLAALSRGAL